MISIIISTANPHYLQHIKDNISATIGIPFELIAVNNPDGKMGLCEVYNKAAAQASNDILCFMHEDIDIKTAGWGHIAFSLFNSNPGLGILGIAGCNYKSLAPSGWAVNRLHDASIFMNIIQHFKFADNPKEHIRINASNQLKDVVSVDGVWFCSTRKIVAEHPFDENMLKGFHGYDLDFSLQVYQKYRLAVTFDILIEHYSEGNLNSAWLADTLLVHTKWKQSLPVNHGRISHKDVIKIETRSFKGFSQMLMQHHYTSRQILKILYHSGLRKVIGTRQYCLLYLALFFYRFRHAARLRSGQYQ